MSVPAREKTQHHSKALFTPANQSRRATSFIKSPSLRGKYWILNDFDEDLAVRIAQGHGLPDMVGRLLSARGIPFDKVDDFLNPRLNKHFPDPFAMKNMQATADYLANAIEQGKKIGILADFDVDGATSCGVLVRFLRHVTGQADIPFFIPDRLNDGYGPVPRGFDALKGKGCDIVIVADCGITSFEPLAYAASIGLETIVLDHHEPEDKLPEAKYIINPKLKDCASGYTWLAAVGVSFLMMVALNNRLRLNGFYDRHVDISQPDMRDFLDLVALGTVCDMVPLQEANRLFVHTGFAQMAARKNSGIRALLEVAKIEALPDPYHAGFSLGPRINAGSRVHRSDLGARLLSTDDYQEALTIAYQLDECNQTRQQIQKDMTREATNMVKMSGQDQDAVICVAHEGFHQGISGLVAGALKDRYNRPACVAAFVEAPDGTQEGRGSGRSVKGVNIAQSFIDGRNQGLLLKGGGHAMAGGFTVARAKFDEFCAFLKQHIGEQTPENDDTPVTEVDAALSVGAASIDFVRIIEHHMGPYGMSNPEPVFMLQNVLVSAPDIVGANHVRCYIKDAEGGRSIKGIAFRASNSELGEALLAQQKGQSIPMHLLGSFHVNTWQGRESVDFHIQDAAFAL